MSLISCRIKLKLRLIKHCVLAARSVKNKDAYSNHIIITMKDQMICSCCYFLRKRKIQIRNINSETNQFIGINIEQTVGIKMRQMRVDVFLNQILYEINIFFEIICDALLKRR